MVANEIRPPEIPVVDPKGVTVIASPDGQSRWFLSRVPIVAQLRHHRRFDDGVVT